MRRLRVVGSRVKAVLAGPPAPLDVARRRATVGEGTSFTGAPWIDGIGTVDFGRWCAVGVGLRIISSNHDMRYANLHVPLQRHLGLPDHFVPGTVRIGDACWVGDSVLMLPGANVGTGSVIGGGAVVTSEIPPFSVAVGVPCRVVRQRFTADVVEALLEVAWWEWTQDQMAAGRGLFELDLTAATGDEVRRAAGIA